MRGPDPGPPPFPLPVRAVDPPRHTRRWFLAGTGAVLLGAGGGVAAEFARKVPKPPPNPPPRALVDALEAENSLLASIARTEHGAHGDLLDQLARDHRAHLQAVHAALAQYDPLRPSSASAPSRAASAAPPSTIAALRKAESAAAGAGTARAGQLRGRNATLLASIAACEATHAELLG